MWMSGNENSFLIMILLFVMWSQILSRNRVSSDSDYFSSEEISYKPKILSSRHKEINLLKIEVVGILDDFSNGSLTLSKSLSRALNSITVETNGEPSITWRVRNFVIHLENNTTTPNVYNSSSRNIKLNLTRELGGERHSKLSPELMPRLCEFLGNTKAVAMIDLRTNNANDKILSLISKTAMLPLLGTSPLTSSLDSEDENSFYINLSSSVRQTARALGHLLIHCHWHKFTLIFDDSPFLISSMKLWTQELKGMRIVTNVKETETYDEEKSEEFKDYDDFDSESNISLIPKLLMLKCNEIQNGAKNALRHLTKESQGVIIIISSQSTLKHVFRAAQKLHMLNGNYVFIILPLISELKVIPEWIPSGVLALSGRETVWTEKYSGKLTGKLLSHTLNTIKNDKIERNEEIYRRIDVRKTRKRSLRSTNNPFYKMSHLTSGPISHFSNWDDSSKTFIKNRSQKSIIDSLQHLSNVSCWAQNYTPLRKEILGRFVRALKKGVELEKGSFEILNLVDVKSGAVRERKWVTVGNVSGNDVNVESIKWIGSHIFPKNNNRGSNRVTYRVVTIRAPPFIFDSDADESKTCVIGLPCLRLNTTDRDQIGEIFGEYDENNKRENRYKLACCDGLAMDLLSSISRELNFKIDLFLVGDGYFGSRTSEGSWNGIMNALITGSAHMSFAPFSVTSIRSTAVDFSTPFFFSAVGFLGMSKNQDVPLMAFLAPFSFELWAAIFLTLNMTALAVALFEWLSPFGLNPWGRQRTKNFSIASALWVVWGRLFSHLVAFKAPKSWPNKFLINVWGGFSVIFVASYTANIAALFAGKFYQRGVDVHDRSLLSQRVAAVKHSATQFYIKRENQQLWEHLQKFPVNDFQQGVHMLKNDNLDLLIGDGPLLDYYRGADLSCSLIDVSNQDKIGDDTYAVAMTKGFPLKESISSLVAKYIGNGYMDHLQGKWYGQLGCFKRNSDLVRARALGVDSVAGMIIMLGIGTLVGLLILTLELIVYKFALPYFRKQPKGTIWRSPNIMFFSQKLYRFINCVELVSPHHAAKELVKTLRQGQITSLFQKSVKRKEREQRRRRKSKAQFFEMIQEIRRVQKHERQQSLQQEDSIETRFSTPPSSSSPAPIYSIPSSNKTPKVVRILGLDIDSTSPYSTTHPLAVPSSNLPRLPEETSDSDGERRNLNPTPPRRRRIPRQRARGVEFDVSEEEEDFEEENVSWARRRSDLSRDEILVLWKRAEEELNRRLENVIQERNELRKELLKINRPP